MRYVFMWIFIVLATNSSLLQATIIRHQEAAINRLATNCPDIKLGTMNLESTGMIEVIASSETSEASNTRTCTYDIDPWLVIKDNAKKNRKY